VNFVKTLSDNLFTIIEHHVVSSMSDNPISDNKHNLVGRCNMVYKPI